MKDNLYTLVAILCATHIFDFFKYNKKLMEAISINHESWLLYKIKVLNEKLIPHILTSHLSIYTLLRETLHSSRTYETFQVRRNSNMYSCPQIIRHVSQTQCPVTVHGTSHLNMRPGLVRPYWDLFIRARRICYYRYKIKKWSTQVEVRLLLVYLWYSAIARRNHGLDNVSLYSSITKC